MVSSPQISLQARQFGICKIVPPPTWKPPFIIDRKNFTVRTRVQQVNYLDGQARQRLIFVENLCRFWSKRGQELEKLPIIAQAPLDVCRCAPHAPPHSPQRLEWVENLLFVAGTKYHHIPSSCTGKTPPDIKRRIQTVSRGAAARRHGGSRGEENVG